MNNIDNMNEIEEVIIKVKQLSSEKNNAETPFESKYRARKLLKDLHNKLKDNGNEYELGIIEVYLGVNYIDTEEHGSGEKYLSDAILKLENETNEYAYELVMAHNHIGILWCQRSEFDRSLKHLKTAQELYESWQDRVRSAKQTNDNELLVKLLKNENDFENLYTHTVFYLGQVYGNTEEKMKAAQYLSITLNRQLESNQYDANEWWKNCAQLAIFYQSDEIGDLRQAYHCLMAADKIRPREYSTEHKEDALNELQRNVEEKAANTNNSNDDNNSIPITAEEKKELEDDVKFANRYSNVAEEELAKSNAEMAKAWGKFYLAWLRFSIYDEESLPKPQNKESDWISFESLPLDEPPTCNLATTFEEAREIFKHALMQFTTALKYYILDGFVTEHIHLQQNVSELYSLLCNFEADRSRRCKMHKRRINILEPLVTALNANVYMDFVRQLSDEVARAYGEMVDEKIAIQKEKNTTMGTEKINQLALKSITLHQLFVRSFHKGDKNDIEPLDLDEFYHRAYLNARFAIARLYGKIYHDNPVTLCTFLKKSLDEYKGLVSFAERINAKVFQDEIEVSKEMIELLPQKMDIMIAQGRSLR